MAKKDKTPEEPVVDQFIGGEEDDLMDMEYVQDEETVSVDTHPPATKEEAELREQAAAEEKAESEEEPKAEEPAEEPEQEPEAVEPEKEHKVPYERFEEVNNKRKEAEEETKRLKEQLEAVVEEKTSEPEPEPYDYETQEKAAMDALLEGDQDKYAELRAKIRDAEREETLREARRIASEGDRDLQENLTFEEVGDRIEREYPQFSKGNDVYEDAAREEMLDLYVGYAKSGLYTRTQALQRAADKTVKMYGFDEKKAEPTPPDNVVTMKTSDPKKKAAAANKQPPAMEGRAAGTGSEEPRLDISSMSDEEFDALPESTKRRARGDIL